MYVSLLTIHSFLQVESLEKLCETREEKIQENKTKIEEVRSLTEEEATNFKDADELIQILTSKVILLPMYNHTCINRNFSHSGGIDFM